MENFEACMDKMLDKFETRIEKLVGDLSTANCRIDKLEQALNARDQVRAQEDAFQHITVQLHRLSPGPTRQSYQQSSNRRYPLSLSELERDQQVIQ